MGNVPQCSCGSDESDIFANRDSGGRGTDVVRARLTDQADREEQKAPHVRARKEIRNVKTQFRWNISKWEDADFISFLHHIDLSDDTWLRVASKVRFCQIDFPSVSIERIQQLSGEKLSSRQKEMFQKAREAALDREEHHWKIKREKKRKKRAKAKRKRKTPQHRRPLPIVDPESGLRIQIKHERGNENTLWQVRTATELDDEKVEEKAEEKAEEIDKISEPNLKTAPGQLFLSEMIASQSDYTKWTRVWEPNFQRYGFIGASKKIARYSLRAGLFFGEDKQVLMARSIRDVPWIFAKREEVIRVSIADMVKDGLVVETNFLSLRTAEVPLEYLSVM